MVDELIDIYDKNNKFLWVKKLKSEAHEKWFWHRAVQVCVYNSNHEILIQLRSKQKRSFPNLWDISVAGHVWIDERPIISAIREIKEEIGLSIKRKNLKFFKIKKCKENKEYFYIYILKLDIDIKDLVLQNEEVEEVKFINIKKLEKELELNPEKFVLEWRYWMESIKEVNKKNFK